LISIFTPLGSKRNNWRAMLPGLLFSRTGYPGGSIAPDSAARSLVQSETDALRITAIGKAPEPRSLRSRRIGFTAGLPDECNCLLQVGNFEENVYLWLGVVAV
jgi:hypothetical protein